MHQSTMTKLAMKIENAKTLARLLLVLHKLKLLSENRYDKLIDFLTVKSFEHQLREKSHDKSIED